MAFHQPTAAPTARPFTAPSPEQNATAPLPSFQQRLDDTREWVLFPSGHAHSSAHTDTASTERTPRTAGLSRLSDFGSLNTAAQPGQDIDVACEATNGSLDEEELDSLDEGLHAFQEPSTHQRSGYFDQTGSILPRHDGLGTFPASSPPVQEQLWHFERHNPRKRPSVEYHRRRSSVQRRLEALDDQDANGLEDDRRKRIEDWRMEQSKVLLDEIERQTRRRRMSAVSHRQDTPSGTAGLEQTFQEPAKANLEEHAPEASPKANTSTDEDSETFLQAITRRVIRDFIGIDDAMLSVIFGETLPRDNPTSSLQASSSKSPTLVDPPTSNPSSTWEKRLLDRLARELGILINQLTDHPGAFSTPLFNPLTSDYAGIPTTQPTSSRTQPRPSHTPIQHQPSTRPQPPTSLSFDFTPTLPTPLADSAHASLWGIEEEGPTSSSDTDYWTQPATLKNLFRLLRTHLTNQQPSPSPKAAGKLHPATSTTPASLHRAAVIRQYHPLVSRAATQWEHSHHNRFRDRERERESWHARRRRGYRGSSCGSRRGMGSCTSGSTRNFWDIGCGKSGGGSGVGSAIGVGGWGDV